MFLGIIDYILWCLIQSNIFELWAIGYRLPRRYAPRNDKYIVLIIINKNAVFIGITGSSHSNDRTPALPPAITPEIALPTPATPIHSQSKSYFPI